MIEIESSMYYAIFDTGTACISIPDFPPIIEIEHGDAIRRNIPFSECWYDEYRLCLKEICTVTTPKGHYLLFSLKDYGVRDFRGIAFQVTTSNCIYDNKEFYHVVSYDCMDRINLCMPIDDLHSCKDITLHLIAARYSGRDFTEYLRSNPISLTPTLKKRLRMIETQRKNHTDFPDENAPVTRKYQSKLPYQNTFIRSAWKAYPEAVTFLDFLDAKCDELDRLINALPASVDKINVSAPSATDDILYIPIECTFNQKFFARLYLAREHSIVNRIISTFDMLQFQIPILASNEPLLLCLYGSHWLEPSLYSPDCECIGEDKCVDTFNEASECSPILSVVAKIQGHPLMRTWCPIIRKSEIGERYSEIIAKLSSWIDLRTKEAMRQSDSIRPSLWKSEYRLYQYVKLICPEAIYQYRSKWLDAQSLDVFIPTYRCAIEYQGRQHYDSIDYFGGDSGLLERQEHDNEKLQKCINNGVRLFEWPYKDKLLFSSILRFMNTNVFSTPVDLSYPWFNGSRKPCFDFG